MNKVNKIKSFTIKLTLIALLSSSVGIQAGLFDTFSSIWNYGQEKYKTAQKVANIAKWGTCIGGGILFYKTFVKPTSNIIFGKKSSIGRLVNTGDKAINHSLLAGSMVGAYCLYNHLANNKEVISALSKGFNQVKEKIKEIRKQMNQRFNQTDEKIDQNGQKLDKQSKKLQDIKNDLNDIKQRLSTKKLNIN